MGKKLNDEMVKDAFALYIKYAGEKFDLIEREMKALGWHQFRQSALKDRKDGDGMREGLITRFGWDKALKKHLADLASNTFAATSAERLLIENEYIRDQLFEEIKAKGVMLSKDAIWQHKRYTETCVKILDKLEAARDNYANFVFFFKHLMKAATTISPALARELCDAEDGIIEWAEAAFVVEEDKPEE